MSYLSSDEFDHLSLDTPAERESVLKQAVATCPPNPDSGL